jgi:hypothetical protein
MPSLPGASLAAHTLLASQIIFGTVALYAILANLNELL